MSGIEDLVSFGINTALGKAFAVTPVTPQQAGKAIKMGASVLDSIGSKLEDDGKLSAEEINEMVSGLSGPVGLAVKAFVSRYTEHLF